MNSSEFAEANPVLTLGQTRSIAAEHHLENELMNDLGLQGLDLVSTEHGLLVKTSSLMEWLGY